jgi:predicted transcriptional regulator
LVQAIFWRNSTPLAASSWAILCVTFFRRGISRKWRSLGFDRDVFRLMVTMKGARSRLTLLSYLNEPRHKSELSMLAGLDWKEADRELNLLERFGLISLHVQSGSVKIYKLTRQGTLLLELVAGLTEVSPDAVARGYPPDSQRKRL